jgi:Domain of unknown function (DUF4388)
MSITGYLSEFSLPELFQLIEEGQKTGRLTIGDSKVAYFPNCQKCYIWFERGNIVAAANSLDDNSLIALIEKRGWLSDRASARIASISTQTIPLGMSLKSANLLQAEQLKLLFQIQVMQKVIELFAWKTGWFDFKQDTDLPTAEMTGLRRSAIEVLLAGLRSLRDWSVFEDKLPDPNSGLINLVRGKAQVQLDSTEVRVWELAQGDISIKHMAKQLNATVENIRQIAFRLILAGLTEEAAISESKALTSDLTNDVSLPASDRTSQPTNNISQTPKPASTGSWSANIVYRQATPNGNGNAKSVSRETWSPNVVYRQTSSQTAPSSQKSSLSPAYYKNLMTFLRSKGEKS